MAGEHQFTDVITTEAELREILGYPGKVAADKAVTALDEFCREFIAQSPFLLIASSDAAGKVDVSPKGDPAGFVHVLNDNTLLIPDRPGNRRADTFTNILQNPQIGLLFLIPGKSETLRVSGRARLVRDLDLREQMAVQGKTPELFIALHVEEAFFHCPKCMVRSQLWHAEAVDDFALIAKGVVAHAQADITADDAIAILQDDAKNGLY